MALGTPAERKARVRWCVDHRLWHYPVAHREPPPGREEERFRPPDKRGYSEMVFDGPDWITTAILVGGFWECVDFEHAYVDPTTERIEDDDARNIAFRVWIEAGGWLDLSAPENARLGEPTPAGDWTDHNKWTRCHSLSLDCGAPDMESAILELAARVEFHYGDGAERLASAPERCEYRKVGDTAPAEEQYVTTCVADSDGYCATCGYKTE